MAIDSHTRKKPTFQRETQEIKLNQNYIGDLERIRTSNPQSRNLIFYPVELRGQIPAKAGISF